VRRGALDRCQPARRSEFREAYRKYAVVAYMTVRQSNALHGSRFRRAVRTPGTWHLAQIVRGDVPSPAPVCNGPTVKDGARLPVGDWEIVRPRCPECESLAGDAARAQAAMEAEES
jgi:hypothetical protein